MNLPELLAPAGDIKKAYTAFEYGADAVYIGVPMFALRTRMNKINEGDIEEIVKYAHSIDRKVYITLNAFPHTNLIKPLRKHLEFLSTVKPDGLIIADTGILNLANEILPDCPKHLSVQASTVSEEGIRFWQKNGVTRIILAREIPIDEVMSLHKSCPDIELEYFVHGAVCMAYSGRCLLSNFMAYRDSNRGMCAHSCRWKYKVYEKEYFVEEEERPGEMIPIEEDMHGTHIMSSRDMCMIEHLKEIIDSGVVSIKIEGRNKTQYYLASVCRAYRKALDDIKKGNDFDKDLWNEIHATANRGFFAGFLHGKPLVEGQQYEENRSTSTHEYCGVVLEVNDDNTILVDVKNRIDIGNTIIVLHADIKDDTTFIAKKLIFKGEEVEVIHGGNGNAIIGIPKDLKIKKGMFLRQEVRNDGLMEKKSEIGNRPSEIPPAKREWKSGLI